MFIFFGFSVLFLMFVLYRKWCEARLRLCESKTNTCEYGPEVIDPEQMLKNRSKDTN